MNIKKRLFFHITRVAHYIHARVEIDHNIHDTEMANITRNNSNGATQADHGLRIRCYFGNQQPRFEGIPSFLEKGSNIDTTSRWLLRLTSVTPGNYFEYNVSLQDLSSHLNYQLPGLTLVITEYSAYGGLESAKVNGTEKSWAMGAMLAELYAEEIKCAKQSMLRQERNFPWQCEACGRYASSGNHAYRLCGLGSKQGLAWQSVVPERQRTWVTNEGTGTSAWCKCSNTSGHEWKPNAAKAN